ncbi:MAG: protein-disulfide isomerase [Moritella sp.]|jgi:protein-disulfide isomerase
MNPKLLAIAGIALVTQVACAAPVSSDYTIQQQAEFNLRVKEALINDPEILKEAILALQAHEQKKSKTLQGDNLEENKAALFDNKLDPWVGAEKPELIIAYFSDFNCGYCKKIEPSLEKLMDAYPEVRVVYKLVPILGQSSQQAAEFALTVWENEPEKFIPLHHELMSQPGRLDSASITKVAKATGTDKWLDNSADSVAETMNINTGLMREFGLSGTPSLIFSDQVVGGLIPYDQLEQRVQQALDAKRNN